jgi:hypothetical protein
MQNAHPKPIMNNPSGSVPAVEFEREPGHSEGDAGVAYVIVAPPEADDRIDRRSGGTIARRAGSRDYGRTGRTTMVI